MKTCFSSVTCYANNPLYDFIIERYFSIWKYFYFYILQKNSASKALQKYIFQVDEKKKIIRNV